MKFWVKLIVGIVFILLYNFGWAEVETNCSAPELMEGFEGYNHYNELVCEGIKYTKEEKFSDAVKAYEQALSVFFLDIPNFELFSKLAWVRFKMGDITRARKELKKAEISLLVYTGMLECPGSGDVSHLKYRYGALFDGEIYKEVAVVMCGEAYDYYYTRESLESVLYEYPLVKQYFDIKRKIEVEEKLSERGKMGR